jgi:hypothetical protein
MQFREVAPIVLTIVGIVDLVRGVLHTFAVRWAARTFARLDLTAAPEDQLTLMGVFGISNFLTGSIYLLVSMHAPQLAADILLLIPCAYLFGTVGLRVAGVRARSAFYGRYFLLGYLLVCLVAGVLAHP